MNFLRIFLFIQHDEHIICKLTVIIYKIEDCVHNIEDILRLRDGVASVII